MRLLDGGHCAHIAAYALNSLGKLEATSKWYKLMNIAGSMAVGYNSLTNEAWPSVGLNAVWFGIGMMSLLKK